MRGSVRGSVVRAESEDPIPGAAVSGTRAGAYPPGSRAPYSLSARSDRAGAFAFDDLTEGEWVFTTHSSGGEVVGRATVRVFDNALSDVTIAMRGGWTDFPPDYDDGEPVKDIAPIRPRPPRRSALGGVRGRIVRVSNEQAVFGATVSVVSGDGREPDICPVSDADGFFALDGLEEGEWLLRALGRDGETGTATVHVFENSMSDVTIEVGIGPRGPRRSGGTRHSHRSERNMRGNVRGRVVRSGSEEPIADASITIVSGPGSAPDIAPVTNESGMFALDGLPAGEWSLRAIAPDGSTGEATVRVAAGSSASVTVQVGTTRNVKGPRST